MTENNNNSPKKFLLTSGGGGNITVYVNNIPYTLPKNSTAEDLHLVSSCDFISSANSASSRNGYSERCKTEDGAAKFLFIDKSEYYAFSPCNQFWFSNDTILLDNESIFCNVSNESDIYVLNEYINYINKQPQEIIDDTLVMCDYSDGGLYVYYLPKGTTEIQDPFFSMAKTFDGDTNINFPLLLLFAPYFKVIDSDKGWTIQNVENVKIPYTLEEISQFMSDSSKRDAIGFSFSMNYYENNYSGTFEFSDGTKKTLAELSALFS